MRRSLPRGVLFSLIAFLVVAGGVWAFSRLLVESLLGDPDADGAGQPEAVAILRIQGGIFDARAAVRSLERLGRRPGVKAVLLRIDSPGGAVSPTQEIYQEVLRLRKAGVKVVASMGSVAASGGYYVAAAADKIYANPGTITGSIGVVMVLPDVQKAMGTLGLRMNVIKSGPNKDVASPFRPMTDKDREILQRLVDDTYAQFVRAVAEGRKMPQERVREIADGSIYSGERAKEIGLVDALGTEREAILEAARLGGIKGEPRLIELKPEAGLWSLLQNWAGPWSGWFGTEGGRFFGGTPAVLEYMWRLS